VRPAKLCPDGKENDMLYTDVIKRVTDWVETEMAIRRMRNIDDRLLADLGIDRKHIADLVRGRCRR
jgi:uncharacterized protein YjiS (DUF1127 family)